jgi:hypothetical protein
LKIVSYPAVLIPPSAETGNDCHPRWAVIIVGTFEFSTRAEESPAVLGAAVAAGAIAAAGIQGSEETFKSLRTYIDGLLRARRQCYSQPELSPTLPSIMTLILIMAGMVAFGAAYILDRSSKQLVGQIALVTSVFWFLLLRWFREYLFPPPILELAAFQRTRLSIALVLMAALAVTPTYADEQSGVASRVCDKVTATGGMDCNALVAASPDLPFGTMVTVVHNGHSEIVKIIDRGPAVWTHRVIDLSTGAGRGISLDGLGAVSLTWDADAIIPLPLYVAPTVVPLVAPVVLVVLHPYHRRPGIRENRGQARVGLPLHRHR